MWLRAASWKFLSSRCFGCPLQLHAVGSRFQVPASSRTNTVAGARTNTCDCNSPKMVGQLRRAPCPPLLLEFPTGDNHARQRRTQVSCTYTRTLNPSFGVAPRILFLFCNEDETKRGPFNPQSSFRNGFATHRLLSSSSS